MGRKGQKELSVAEEIPFPKDIRFNKNLTFGERIFLAEIHSMTVNGVCPFSSSKFTRLFQVTYPTLKSWIKKLVKLNLIEIGIDYDNPDSNQQLKIKNEK
jgi:hypothetical protein